MPRPRLLTDEQEAELRQEALAARAESPHRGYGAVRGAVGRNATEVLVDLVRDRWGITMTERSMQRILGRLGLEYRAAGQGGRWVEA